MISSDQFGGSSTDSLYFERNGYTKSDTLLEYLETKLETMPFDRTSADGVKRVVFGLSGDYVLDNEKSLVRDWSDFKPIHLFASDMRYKFGVEMGINKNDHLSVILEYHPSGKNIIPFHHSTELNCTNTIVLLTLGGNRLRKRLYLRSNQTMNIYRNVIRHGDIIMMSGSTNRNYAMATPSGIGEQQHLSNWVLKLRVLKRECHPKPKKNKVKLERSNVNTNDFIVTMEDHPWDRKLKLVHPTNVQCRNIAMLTRIGKIGKVEYDCELIKNKAAQSDKDVRAGEGKYMWLVTTDDIRPTFIRTLRRLLLYWEWKYPCSEINPKWKPSALDLLDNIFDDRTSPGSIRVSDLYVKHQPIDLLRNISSQRVKQKRINTCMPEKIIHKRWGYPITTRVAFKEEDQYILVESTGSEIYVSMTQTREQIKGLKVSFPQSRYILGGLGPFTNYPMKQMETRAHNRIKAGTYVIFETRPKEKDRAIGIVTLGKKIELFDTEKKWEHYFYRHLCTYPLTGLSGKDTCKKTDEKRRYNFMEKVRTTKENKQFLEKYIFNLKEGHWELKLKF